MGGSPFVAEPTALKGIKGKNFHFFKALFLFYCSSFHGMMRADHTMEEGDCLINNIFFLIKFVKCFHFKLPVFPTSAVL